MRESTPNLAELPKEPKFIPKSELEDLSQEIGQEKGYYRIRSGNRVYHLTIDCDVYDEDTMGIPFLLIPRLPALPEGIEPVWHPQCVDVLSLRKPKRYRSGVHEVLFNSGPAFANIACWAHEIPRLGNETYVYQLLAEQDTRDEISPIAPGFLAHLTENGCVMGFLMEEVEGRFASIDDLAACERALGRFHGDVNRYNFLVDRASGEVRLLDFKQTRIFDPEKAAQ
ncbi:hypothetical protein NUU61_002870 [Penicillium alfredii]|uniref:Aminoglycoside phosphotransferase domain-containing protein n=1 Tax=Penicillium alfredii TaxID=1506179 RepID=A0A9W9KHC4_9EURO|nr:uncharacterized protein NUU61_002870 [Penicillium alfredii]KAJ5105523.1 hypothetical protein NUU61_002870 [Penicillium alfredii]